MFPFDPEHCAAPLPRAYQFADGSAYLNHVALVRRARGAELPAELLDDPLMYQGASDGFLGPTDPIAVADEALGIDLEAEVAVITDDVPMGTAPAAARGHIKLVMLLNDVSLRRLIPAELAKGFGFFQGKPRSACSPVAVTPDALGAAWRDGKLHGALRSSINGKELGRPDAGVEMQFDFGRLIAHAAKTRPLAAGTIVGSGTVSNQDPAVGSSCLAEVRIIETIERGKADDRLPQVRRPRADRDARRGRPHDLRRDRSAGRALRGRRLNPTAALTAARAALHISLEGSPAD